MRGRLEDLTDRGFERAAKTVAGFLGAVGAFVLVYSGLDTMIDPGDAANAKELMGASVGLIACAAATYVAAGQYDSEPTEREPGDR